MIRFALQKASCQYKLPQTVLLRTSWKAGRIEVQSGSFASERMNLVNNLRGRINRTRKLPGEGRGQRKGRRVNDSQTHAWTTDWMVVLWRQTGPPGTSEDEFRFR